MNKISAKPPVRETSGAARPRLFIECTHTYHSPVQSGIQRVVRNILRNAGEVAGERGYAVVPVVYEGGQFRAADLRQVLDDKLQPPVRLPWWKRVALAWQAWRAKSLRARVLAFALPVYRQIRRSIAMLLPFRPVHRFLFAYPSHFGMGWCALLPWRIARRLVRIVVPSAVLPVIAAPFEAKDEFGMSLDAIADHRGNVLLLLDGSWHLPIWSAVSRFMEAGGVVQTVIHDLIPITHPDTVMPGVREAYVDWMEAHLKVSRRFMATSRTGARQMQAYLADVTAGEPVPKPWTIGSFYLGSELDFADPDLLPGEQVEALFAGPDHVFMVVGSIEPRKNHEFILDAFERHWNAGGTAMLAVIGRYGWGNEALIGRIGDHTMLGTRLFLLRDMADSELDYAYRHASALIIASKAEGFGLPVVEAFQYGLPVLCSDIEVFREIADGRAMFFSLDDPARLTAALDDFCATHDPALRRLRDPQPWLTWRESTEQLLDVLLAQPARVSKARELSGD
jgi:alpha-1,2-rhamnosyltransferase